MKDEKIIELFFARDEEALRQVEEKYGDVDCGTTQYEYDAVGRITQDTCTCKNQNGVLVEKDTSYQYDSYGRLVRENNRWLDKTFVFCYDDIGNIKSVKTYSYTAPDTTPTGTPTTKTFNYGNATHVDRLTEFGTKSITYNANGEMTSFDGWTYSWSKGKLHLPALSISMMKIP